jgi:hypothetical protein
LLAVIFALIFAGCEQPTDTPTVTLTGITADYDGTTAVYPDTPLDDLKTDLTVTAAYSDNTSKTLAPADYTLSGTLTVGNSSITVTYQGQTDTFTDTVTNPATPTYTVSGTITSYNPSGVLAGATVTLKEGAVTKGTAATAANGTYTISNVPDGTYTIEVSKNGYNTGTITNIAVTGANVTGKNLQLTNNSIPTYTVSGIITANMPVGTVTGATVNLKNGDTVIGTDTSTWDGGYIISNVPDGTYTIEVSYDGYTTGTISNVVVTGANVTGQHWQLIKESSGGLITSPWDIGSYLTSSSGGASASDPVLLALEMDIVSNWSSILTEINSANKYVSLDLSACADYIFIPGSANTGEKFIVSLILPDSVYEIIDSSILDSTFRFFTSIKAIEGEGVITVGSFAFYNRTSLQTVSFPALKTVEDSAFLGCTALTSNITIANTGSIGDAAFADCSSLISLTIGNSVTIGEVAFYGCSGLRSVTFGTSVSINTSTDDASFYGTDLGTKYKGAGGGSGTYTSTNGTAWTK